MIVTVANVSCMLDTPPVYGEGHVLTRVEAQVLNEVWLFKVRIQLQRYLKNNPNITLAQFHAEAKRIQETLVLDQTEANDTLEIEALEISKEKILAKLAAEGLPPPNNLDLHARELAQNPRILALAKLRIEARFRAGLELSASRCTADT